jgi:hypothetical protein
MQFTECGGGRVKSSAAFIINYDRQCIHYSARRESFN